MSAKTPDPATTSKTAVGRSAPPPVSGNFSGALAEVVPAVVPPLAGALAEALAEAAGEALAVALLLSAEALLGGEALET